MLKTSSHVLSTSRKHTTGFLVKCFGECCVCTVLTTACYWRQVTVFLLRRLCPCRESSITTFHRWCWTPTMVCAAATAPFHSLHQRFSTFSLKGDKSRPIWFCWRASLNLFFFLTQFDWHVLFYSRTKSVTRNIRRFIERLKAAQCGPQNRGWEPLFNMNWIDSRSCVEEGVTVGSCRINCFLLAEDLVLLASSQQTSPSPRSVFYCVRPSRNENQY